MRVVVSAFLGMAAMAAVSAQAAPISVPAEVELGGPPPVELVAQGCGHGFKPRSGASPGRLECLVHVGNLAGGPPGVAGQSNDCKVTRIRAAMTAIGQNRLSQERLG